MEYCKYCGIPHDETVDCWEANGIDLTEIYLEERNEEVRALEDAGAEWDFYSLSGQLYDADANTL